MPISAGDVAMRFAALADDDIDDAIHEVVHEIGTWASGHGATRCFLVRWHDDGTFTIAAEWSADHLDPLLASWGVGRDHQLDGLSFWTEQERRGVAGALGRTDDLPPAAAAERALLEADGADAFLHTLIRRGGETHGVLAWRFEDGRGDPQPVADVSDRLASALAVAFLRLDDLDDPGVALTERLLGADDETFQDAFNGGTGELGRSVDADRVRVVRFHPDTTSGSIIAGWHRPNVDPPPRRFVDPSTRLPLQQFGRTPAELMRGGLIRVDDVPATAARLGRDLSLNAAGVRSLLIVPVQPRGTTLGWVVVTRVRPNDGWTDRDVRRARRFALSLRPLFSRMDSVEERRRELAERSEQLAATLGLVSELSHQLRTPLHAIAGYAELIDAERLETADRNAVEHIRTGADELAAYVDDILAVSRSDDGTAPLRPAIDAALEHLAADITSRRIRVDADVAPTAFAPINRARTRQLTRSLVQSLLLAAGANSTLRIATSHGSLTARLDSTNPIASDALSFPLAAALLGRDGTVEAERLLPDTDDRTDSVLVTIRFGPTR